MPVVTMVMRRMISAIIGIAEGSLYSKKSCKTQKKATSGLGVAFFK